jgi:nitrogen regulatory protein PII
MKRIELVIEPSAIDRFTEAARGLNLPDFDVSEVRRATGSLPINRQRFYRGREFALDLVERLRIDLNVADDAATRLVHEFIQRVQPESISILRLDRTVGGLNEAATISPHPIAASTAAMAAGH